jgi:hypothetical protein
MSKISSIVFRSILLLAGFGIVVLAGYLVNGDYAQMTWGQRYTWISIALMYAVVFVPSFFPPSLKIKNIGKISAYAIMWVFIIIYLCGSIGLLVYVNSHVYKIPTVIIIHCVLLFLIAIGLDISLFTTSHTAAVQSEEDQSMSIIETLRNTSAALELSANRLGSEHDDVKKRIRNIADDLRYLSSSDTPEASALEQKIYTGLGDIGTSPVFRGEGGSLVELKQRINSVQFLIDQRKLILKK